MSEEEFRDAMLRAASVIDNMGTGRAPSIGQRMSLLELAAITCRDGHYQAPMFLQHPAHLPEGNELKKLMSSTAASDAQLRADAREWVEVNKAEALRGMVILRNVITALREAKALEAEQLNDDDKKKVFGWFKEVRDYVALAFAVDPRQAPVGKEELDAWALAMCHRANPVPEWMRDHRGDGRAPMTERQERKWAPAKSKHFTAAVAEDEE